MEDTSYILCQHKTYMGENFCHKCGGIFIPNINQAIKPRRYNTKIEMPVYSTNKQMMNDYELTQKLIQKTATSNEYIYNRKEVIKQFRFLIERLKFHEETFHSALFMTDLIMTKNPELPYEHVAIGCLSLAVKFIEIDTTIPDLSYLQIIFRSKKYSIRQIKNFELRFIRLLNYNVNYVTPYKFLRLLLTEGIVFPTDFQQDKEDLNNTKDVNDLKKILCVYNYAEEILKRTIESKDEFNLIRC